MVSTFRGQAAPGLSRNEFTEAQRQEIEALNEQIQLLMRQTRAIRLGGSHTSEEIQQKESELQLLKDEMRQTLDKFKFTGSTDEILKNELHAMKFAILGTLLDFVCCIVDLHLMPCRQRRGDPHSP